MALTAAIATIVAAYDRDGVSDEYGFTGPGDCVAHARDVLTLPGTRAIGGYPIDTDDPDAWAYIAVVSASDAEIAAALSR